MSDAKWRWEVPPQKFIHQCILDFGPNPFMPEIPNAPSGWEYDGYTIPPEVTREMTQPEIAKLQKKLNNAHRKWTKHKMDMRKREMDIRANLIRYRVQQKNRGVDGPELVKMVEDKERECRKHYEELDKKKENEKADRRLATLQKNARRDAAKHRGDDTGPGAQINWCSREEMRAKAYRADPPPVTEHRLFTGAECLQLLREGRTQEGRPTHGDIYGNLADAYDLPVGPYWTPPESESSSTSDEEDSWTTCDEASLEFSDSFS